MSKPPFYSLQLWLAAALLVALAALGFYHYNALAKEQAQAECLNRLYYQFGIAEGHLLNKNYVPNDSLLQLLATSIKVDLEEGRLDKQDPSVQLLLEKFRAISYPINVPMEDTEKLVYYVQEGNFKHIFSTVVERGYAIWLVGTALLASILLILLYRNYPQLKQTIRPKRIIHKKEER